MTSLPTTVIATAPPLAIRVLFLEDRPDDAELAVRALLKESITCDWQRVQTEAEFVAALESTPDLVLADYRLPQFDGLQALQLLRARHPDLPFILVTGTLGDELAATCMRLGATDYVLKDRLARLAPAIRRALAEAALRAGQREAEAALRRSEEKYRTLFEQAADGIYISDAEGRLLDTNIHGCELFGCEREAVVGSAITDHIVPAERRRALAEIRQPTPLGLPGCYEYRRRDGRTFRGETSLKTLPDGRLLSIVRDVTAREAAEQRIREQADLLNQTKDIIVVTDLQGRITFWNKGAERLGGWTAGEAVGQPIDALLGAELAETLAAARSAVERDGTWSSEIALRNREGRLLWLDARVTPLRDSSGRPSGRLSIATDITARRQAEQARRDAEARLETATNAAGIGIWDWEIASGEIVWSPQHAHLWDIPLKDFRGTYAEFEARIHPDDRAALTAAVTAALTNRTEFQHEYRLVRPDGGIRWISGRGRGTYGPDGQPVRMTGIVADISERKQLEDQFIRAQRMENLGLLAAGIAHDLNNILTPIMMIAPLFRTRLTSETDQRLLATMEQSVQRGAGLVKQVLSFARGSGATLATMQVKHIAREISAMVRETFPHNIRHEADIGTDLHPVLANPSQLHQVILNLCVNARDAMPEGGTLTLRVANCSLDDDAAAAIREGRPGEFVLIEVADTGTGIPPEIVERIWDPFFTTKGEGKGTGLGLSTVRGIVSRHRGFIGLESAAGRGTTFRVYLPVDAAAAPPPNPASRPPHAPAMRAGHAETVLFVEDEADIRTFVQATLIQAGYRLLLAPDATSAQALFATHVAEIGLVITDHDLPDMPGPRLVAALRGLRPDLPALICSGTSNRERVNLLDTEFLLKPFESSQLLAAIQRLLRR